MEAKKEESSGENVSRWALGLFIFLFVLLLIICLSAIKAHLSVGGVVAVVVVVIVLIAIIILQVIYHLIPLYLAPQSWFFTYVDEGCARIILKGGKYEKTLMNYKGCRQDCIGNIEKVRGARRGEKQTFWGGITFFGMPSLHRVLVYHQKWNALRESEIKSYDEYLDRIFLGIDYYCFIFALKDKEAVEDINKVGLSLVVVVPARIYNPYKAIYLTKNWVDALSAILRPIVENFVSMFRWDQDLIGMKVGKDLDKEHKAKKKTIGKFIDPEDVVEGADLRNTFWKFFKNITTSQHNVKEGPKGEGENLIINGVIVYKDGFTIYKVDPDPTYRDIAAKEYEETRLGEARIKKAELEAKARKLEGGGVRDNILERIAGIPLAALAKVLGIPESEVPAYLKQCPDALQELKYYEEEGRKREAMDADAYHEYQYPPGQEISSLLDRFRLPKEGEKEKNKEK